MGPQLQRCGSCKVTALKIRSAKVTAPKLTAEGWGVCTKLWTYAKVSIIGCDYHRGWASKPMAENIIVQRGSKQVLVSKILRYMVYVLIY